MNINQLKEEVQKDGFEACFKVYYGIYYAIVVDNKDPNEKGQVKVKIPAITGDAQLPNWAEICNFFTGNDSGFVAVPAIGEGVWVSFKNGNPRFPVVLGGWWSKPSNKDSELPQEARGEDYPNILLLKSNSGHYLLFNDNKDIVKLFNKDQSFVELSDKLVKLNGSDEPAVLGDQNADVHSSHISELTKSISELNNLISLLIATFTAQGATLAPLAPIAAQFATNVAPIIAQLATITIALNTISTVDVPATKSTKVKLS